MKRRIKTLLWRKYLKLNAARCFAGTHATVGFTRETFVTSGSRVKRVLIWGDVKVEKDIVTFIEEEGEDILVAGRPQIERATVSLRNTCHPRNIRDKRLPREA